MTIDLKQAQENIINKESMKKIKLPGNRKARRKMMKDFKIPAFAVQKSTMAESKNYTKQAMNNVIELEKKE